MTLKIIVLSEKLDKKELYCIIGSLYGKLWEMQM